ncbi:MAG: LLM class flavin-dependent oxidoreductase [Rhodospirillaceae bacterium]|nr:LLM class flavin-dependent oxidoreductase [Rhodospirillaceae bacterium]
MNTMKYGLFVRSQYPDNDDMSVRFEELMEQARLGEKLGFSSILKGQHYAGYPLQELQQVPFLARVMAECPSLSLITGIVLLSLHKPLDIAEQLATLDIMSKGKLIFGAGLGYRDVELKAFGTNMAERAFRFEENLEAIVQLWTNTPVTMKGSHFELDNVTPSSRPVQKPRPPIWIGANADVAVERAARLSDAWFINPHQRLDTIERQLEVYKRALDAANKPFPDELPLMRELFVAPTREEAKRLAQPYLEEKYKIYSQWGQDKAMPKGDDDLSMAFDELADGRFIFGSPDEVTEQIIRFNKTLGANHFVFSPHWVGMPNNLVLDMMNLMAEEVFPNVEQAL